MAGLTSGSFSLINANYLKIEIHSDIHSHSYRDSDTLHMQSQTRILPFTFHMSTVSQMFHHAHKSSEMTRQSMTLLLVLSPYSLCWKEQTKSQCLPIINRLSNRWRTKYRYTVVTSQIRQFITKYEWGLIRIRYI